MRDCWVPLGLPSTMPAESPAGTLLPPGCTLFTWRLRPHRLVSLKCPVPKASPCPSPQTPGQLLPQNLTGHPGPLLSPSSAKRCYPAPIGMGTVTSPNRLPQPQTPPATLELNREMEMQELTTVGFPPKSKAKIGSPKKRGEGANSSQN